MLGLVPGVPFIGYGELSTSERVAKLAELAVLRAKAEVQAQVVLTALRAAYATAWATTAATYLAPGPKDQILANLRRDESYVNDKLAGTYLRWARAGKRDDGTLYTWEKWFDFADDVASDIYTQAAVNLSGFYDAGAALVATGRQIVELMIQLGKAAGAVAGAALAVPWWVWAAGAVVLGGMYLRRP